MGEEQSKTAATAEERFEEGLRQILAGAPADGGRTADGKPPPERPDGRPRPDGAAAEKTGTPAPGKEGKKEKEPKALFWFKLARLLAIPALLALLLNFILRITADRG